MARDASERGRAQFSTAVFPVLALARSDGHFFIPSFSVCALFVLLGLDTLCSLMWGDI